MERFKFRGMTLGGEWVYGNLAIINKKIKSCGMTIDAGFYISNKVGMPFAYPVRPETIGQCTGLRDENGKLIYEGDIVKDLEGYKGEVSYDELFGKFIIEFVSDISDFLNDDSSELKIIGNIHENADLLGEE